MSVAAGGQMSTSHLNLRLEAPVRGSLPVVVVGDEIQACDIDRYFQVAVAADKADTTAAPLFGTAKRIGNELIFRPTFPFSGGLRYRVSVECPSETDLGPGPSWSREFEVPTVLPSREVEILDIFPLATELPANTLRFYISYASDMRGRFKRSDVALRDEKGRDIAGAFMSFGAELWSPDGHRLTLLIDPGRIKRGITANAVEGTPFEPGRRYVLSVQGSDHNGNASTMHAVGFKVGDVDLRPIDPNSWKVGAPASGTRAPLTVQFDRVMDRALLADSIAVVDSIGTKILGTLRSDDSDRAIAFIPDRDWRPGWYRIQLAAELEDVCGNRIDEALDHLVGETLNANNSLSLIFQVP